MFLLYFEKNNRIEWGELKTQEASEDEENEEDEEDEGDEEFIDYENFLSKLKETDEGTYLKFMEIKES